MVITEALAELKTLQKRIEKKREAIVPYLMRQAIVVDPFEDKGGSKEYIRRERQALADLETRIVALRTAIQKTNHATHIGIEGQTKTIAEWLTWRKEVAPGAQKFASTVRNTINKLREDSAKRGGQAGAEVKAEQNNIIVNIDEQALLKEIEQIENILGQLDGQLSLKNATVLIEL